jgi:spermidine/putrescine transport system permease protein
MKIINKISFLLTIFSVFMIIYIPIIFIIFQSFCDADSLNSQKVITFKWYKYLLFEKHLITALLNSIKISIGTTILSLSFGLITAIGIRKLERKFINIFYLLILFPFIVSDTSTALAQSLIFQLTPIHNSTIAVILSQSISGISFASVAILTGILNIKKTIIISAYDLGASEYQLLRYIIIPKIIPNIIIITIIIFTLCMIDFNYTYFNSGSGETSLSIFIYSSLRFNFKPFLYALATIILFFAIILFKKSEKFVLEVLERNNE